MSMTGELATTGVMSRGELSASVRSAGARPAHGVDLHDCKDGVHEDDPVEQEIPNQEIIAMGIKDGTAWATDDVKGVSLDPKLVEEARKVEIEWFNARGVYTKVPRHQARGQKTIRCRRVDVNKGDNAAPDYRSRLIGKEFATEVDPDLYASMPPLEGLRYVVSMATTQTSGSERRCIMVNDVSRAYFFAPATRELYVELPKEDQTPGMDLVGRLN